MQCPVCKSNGIITKRQLTDYHSSMLRLFLAELKSGDFIIEDFDPDLLAAMKAELGVK